MLCQQNKTKKKKTKKKKKKKKTKKKRKHFFNFKVQDGGTAQVPTKYG